MEHIFKYMSLAQKLLSFALFLENDQYSRNTFCKVFIQPEPYSCQMPTNKSN